METSFTELLLLFTLFFALAALVVIVGRGVFGEGCVEGSHPVQPSQPVTHSLTDITSTRRVLRDGFSFQSSQNLKSPDLIQGLRRAAVKVEYHYGAPVAPQWHQERGNRSCEFEWPTLSRRFLH